MLATVTPSIGCISSGQSTAGREFASLYELRFSELCHAGRGLAFPCDRGGEVQLDALSERARNNYFFARTVVGRHFGPPIVIALENSSTH